MNNPPENQTPKKPNWVFLILFFILILALFLRIHAVLKTEVDNPLRADAGEYYLYAYNMDQFGIFSHDAEGFAQKGLPQPDAYRTPGYPLFLYLFMDGKSTQKAITQTVLVQALLSTLVVFLVFSLCRNFFTEPIALFASLLTALSPHLINVNTYILSEGLFCFFMMLFFWFLCRNKDKINYKTVFVFGILLGLASLVRPVLQYFVICMAFFFMITYGINKGWKLGAIIVAGYLLVFGPWMARNLVTLGIVANDSVKYYNLKFGMYPNLMYKDDPKTFGYPYKFDPNAVNVKPELGSILKEVQRRFTEEPGRHLKWYGYEKAIFLLSWTMAVGAGEHFVYPVLDSPYLNNPLFQATSQLMKVLHWPLMFLGLTGCVLVWLPACTQTYRREQIFCMKILSLLVLYFLAIHILSFSLPRYSIPFRPILYTMACFPVAYFKTLMSQKWNPTLSPSKVPST